MKKSILFLMPALLLATSCGPSKDNSSQDGTSQGGSSNESTSVTPSSSEEEN